MNNYIKTFLDSNDEQFNYKPVQIAGDDLLLITPKDMSTRWNDSNKNFRSIIVNPVTYQVVSMGFSKFTNYGERPDFQTWNDEWKFEARHKLDGSLLIVSRYKGQWILRTRGTVDARSLPNGHEIDLLMKKYSKFFDRDWNDQYGLSGSLLFEWTTPNNIIVLREHDEPTLTLLGLVTHENCVYLPQLAVDSIADTYGFERPVKYEYNSIAECVADVQAWQGKEGVVIYSPDYQFMKKIKADAYCELHKIATGLVTVKNVVELFMATPRFTKYSDFYHYVETTKDYEVAEKIKDHMLAITVAYSKVLVKIEGVKNVVEHVRNGFSRREQALEFQQNYQDIRLSAAFCILDENPIPDKIIENMILLELKN